MVCHMLLFSFLKTKSKGIGKLTLRLEGISQIRYVLMCINNWGYGVNKNGLCN